MWEGSERSLIAINKSGSIFYFGYLVAQYPAGYAMQRLSIGKFLGSATVGE